MSPARRGRSDLPAYLAGAVALAVCCGGPLLLAALAVSGLGGWLVANGLLLGLVGLALGIALVAWALRRALRTQQALTEHARIATAEGRSTSPERRPSP